MNRATIDHSLVTAYLRQLDAALVVLPAKPARELREQITGHLDDALQPGASDEEVAEQLRRLGRPTDLVAEAVATAGKRSWLARVGWRRWSVIAAVVIVLGGLAAGLASYLAPPLTAGPLETGGLSSWYYLRDGKHEVDTSADGVNQTGVPIREGHSQGFLVELYNGTSQPQTVLRAAEPFDRWDDSPYHLGMATVNPDHLQVSFRTLHYSLPVTVPPHASRLLRVLWVPDTCLPGGGEGGVDRISLRVRVGPLTRTETVPLGEGWYLLGHGSCGS